MGKGKRNKRIYYHAHELINEKGYISPIDLFLKMERVTWKQVESWRLKQVPYLERVINGNLSQLHDILKILKQFAKEQHLKPSLTVYKSWGKGPRKHLRFSKTGNPHMEELYSTHFVKKP